MTPIQKLKRHIIEKSEYTGEVTAENVDSTYSRLSENYAMQDMENEVREGEEETGLPSPTSRYYESKSVAAKMSDGTWIGWTYWFGGGKHGEPEAIDWMDDAVEIQCKTEMKPVNIFSLKEVSK
jgi:hypothetical protein